VTWRNPNGEFKMILESRRGCQRKVAGKGTSLPSREVEGKLGVICTLPETIGLGKEN